VSVLEVERAGDGVAVVTLNRPEKRNALSIELRERLAEAFAELAADEELSCLVLTGAGSAFCSGMDVGQFGGDRANKERLVASSGAAFDGVRTCALPVIAAVNGPAVAGGFALALLCDLRIAADTARFGFAELPRGIPPSFPAVRAVLAPALAAELSLTGRLLDAEAALEAGIVSEVVPAQALEGRARALAAEIASAPRAATLETKRRILLDRDHGFGPLFADEAEVFRQALLGEES
jgi:enoyl-CoA hydratase